MKCSEVSDSDVRSAAQLVNMLHTGAWTLSGKELCAAADTIRAFQKIAVAISEGYQTRSAAPEAPTPAVAPPVVGPLGPGVTIKEFNPGKLGKK